MRQVEFLTSAQGDRGAEHTSCVLEHEVYLLCVDFLCGDDEVALVFAIFVIYNDDKLTFLEVLYCIFDAIEFDICHLFDTFYSYISFI